MDKKETKKFMERIKSHYQEFIIDEFKFSEWYGFLKDYDDEDVNKKFEEHLNSEVYGNQIPKVAFLTKFLIKSKDKGKIKHYTVLCPKCGQAIFDEELDIHVKRCIEVSTIVRDFKRYFNKTLKREKLFNLSDDEFEKLYQEYINVMLNSNKVETFKKKILMHIKYPEYTVDDINEIIKEIVKEEIKNE